MAAALVASTAMAFRPNTTGQQMQFAPGAQEKIAKVHQEIMHNIDAQNGPAKASTSGKDWTVRVNIEDKWCTYLQYNDGSKPTFEEMPLYWVVLYTYDDNQNARTAVFYDFCWPSIAMAQHWQDDSWYVGSGDDAEFDWEKAYEEYGSEEAAQAIAPVEDFVKMMEEGGPAYVWPMGYFPTYYSCANMQIFSSAPHSCAYQGTQGYQLKPAGVSGNSLNTNGAAYITLKSYDPETMDMSFQMFAPMGTPKNGEVVVKGTVEDEVTTGAAVFGFAPINLTPDEVHIFNLGEANADYEMGDGYTLGDFYEDFQPANMYYVAYCTAPLTFEGKYTATTVPVEVAVTGSQAATDEFNYFTSYLTLAANADPENTVPEGLATYTWYKFDKDGFLTNEIGPGFLWPSNYYSTQCNDSQTVLKYMGGDGALFGWNSAPYPDLNEKGELQGVIAKIGFGDKTNGFNSYYKSSLGSLVSVKFTGNVKYHYDSRDYTKVKEVPAVGTSDANTLGVKAISGNESNAPVVGVEYYNFQGVRMANAPQKGLYIVRELKADGTVSVKKVAK